MVSCVCNTRSYPRDCQDVKDNGHLTSGVYRVYPACAYIGLNVYCDMDTDGGGWLVSMFLTFTANPVRDPYKTLCKFHPNLFIIF